MGILWSYDMGLPGRTFKGSLVVRCEGVRTYGVRVLGRTTREPLNEREQEWTKQGENTMLSEYFLNGNEPVSHNFPSYRKKADRKPVPRVRRVSRECLVPLTNCNEHVFVALSCTSCAFAVVAAIANIITDKTIFFISVAKVRLSNENHDTRIMEIMTTIMDSWMGMKHCELWVAFCFSPIISNYSRYWST